MFTEIYKYVFEYLKEEGMRNVKGEDGAQIWGLILPEHFGSRFAANNEKIQAFLTKKVEAGELPAIKKDEWTCMLDFLYQTDGGDVSKYVDDGCWPLLIDQLVEAL